MTTLEGVVVPFCIVDLFLLVHCDKLINYILDNCSALCIIDLTANNGLSVKLTTDKTIRNFFCKLTNKHFENINTYINVVAFRNVTLFER